MQDDVTNLTTLLSDEEWIALIEGQPLPAGRAAEVRVILQRHPQLAELAAQMQGDREALSVIDVQRRSGSADVVPPADLLERIEQTLEREALVGLATIEAKAPAAEELPRYVPAAARSRREPLVPARWIGPLGLAASLLLVAGGAVLVWQSSRPKPVEPMLVGATGTGREKSGATDRTMQIAVKDSSKESGTLGAGSSGATEPMVTPTETLTTLAAKEPEPAPAPTVTADPAARAEQGASPVTIAGSPSSDATPASRSAPESAPMPAPALPTAKVAAAEPMSDDALLAAALEGRLVAIVTPASMQRRMDIDQRMAKLAEQPMALAPVQRISVEMATGQAASQVALNAFTQRVVLADGMDLLPAEVRSRLNLLVAQGEPVSPAGSDPQTVARGGGSGEPSPAMPGAGTPGVAPASVMQPMNQGAHMLTLPRLGRATTPATSSGIALLRRSLTGSSDEVLLVVLPPAAEGEDAARVWLAMTGIDDPVMQPWDAGEILWWTVPTQQITPRVVVPVLVTPGKGL